METETGATWFRRAQHALEKGALDEAEKACREAICLSPSLPQPWQLLAIIQDRAGREDAALEAIESAILLAPQAPAYNSHRAVLLRNAGRLEEAKASLEKTCANHPDNFGAQYNLGLVLQDLHSFARAEKTFRIALQLRPDATELRVAIAECCAAQGKVNAAYREYYALSEIMESSLSSRDMQSAIGLAIDAGETLQATEWAKDYAKHNGDDPIAWTLLGDAWHASGELLEAAGAFKRVADFDPQSSYAAAKLGAIYLRIGMVEKACDWFEASTQMAPNDRKIRSAYLLALQHQPGVDRDIIFEQHYRWGADFSPETAKAAKDNVGACGKIRIGYLSPRFADGPLEVFFLPVFRQHNRDEFEFHAYFTGGRPSQATMAFLKDTDGWRDLSNLGTEQACRLIEQDKIDVLVDLAGHSPGNRLDIFARRAAPMQLSWLDYFNTTGLATMDGLLVDRYLVAGEEKGCYTENLYYLPNTRLAYSRSCTKSKVSKNPPSRKTKNVTFGMLGRLSKLNSDVVETWSRILLAVPQSRILFKSNDLLSSGVGRMLADRFAVHNISEDRLIFREETSVSKMLSEYGEVDLVLDTFPFTGCATSYDALSMGVPMITLQGDCLLSRQGVSILSNLGRTEWIADTKDAYVEKAVGLADSVLTNGFDRRELGSDFQACPLADISGFTEALEHLFRSSVQRITD